MTVGKWRDSVEVFSSVQQRLEVSSWLGVDKRLGPDGPVVGTIARSVRLSKEPIAPNAGSEKTSSKTRVFTNVSEVFLADAAT